jgi:MipA family protein
MATIVVFEKCMYAAAALAFGCALATPAFGQSADWRFKIGGAAELAPEFEGSRNYAVQPLPLAQATYRDWLTVSLREGRGDLLALAGRGADEYGQMRAGPLVRYTKGRAADSNDALRGFRNLKDAVEVGGFVGYSLGAWSFDLVYAQAVNDDTHDGAFVEPSVVYRLPLGERLGATFGAKGGWASARAMKNLFGIDAATSRASGLAQHATSAGVKDAGLSANLDYAVTPRASLGVGIGYKRLLGDAADSPLVGERGSRNQFSSMTGLVLKF